MKFDEYLKKCRVQNGLTQEQLVNALYIHDTEHFGTIDVSSYGKWERSTTQPRAAKKVSIVKYFQQITNTALPCLNDMTVEQTEEIICNTGMKNLLGKSKKLIMNYLEKMMSADDIEVIELRHSAKLVEIINMALELDKGFSHKFDGMEPEELMTWALHPSSSFFLCEYKHIFLGVIFSLRLKPETFEKIMNMEIFEKDLTVDDFASLDEVGTDYGIFFFSLNEKAATMLFIRYYAHLIANQHIISEVGLATMMDDARKFLVNMNYESYKTQELENGHTRQTSRATLSNFLASEYTINMLLAKQECVEE